MQQMGHAFQSILLGERPFLSPRGCEILRAAHSQSYFCLWAVNCMGNHIRISPWEGLTQSYLEGFITEGKNNTGFPVFGGMCIYLRQHCDPKDSFFLTKQAGCSASEVSAQTCRFLEEGGTAPRRGDAPSSPVLTWEGFFLCNCIIGAFYFRFLKWA